MKSSTYLPPSVRRLGVTMASVFGAGLLAWWFENWRGFHQLEETRAKLAAKGETIALRQRPEAVPDAENFGALRVWAAPPDINRDGLSELKRLVRQEMGVEELPPGFADCFKNYAALGWAGYCPAGLQDKEGHPGPWLEYTLRALDPFTRELREAADRPASVLKIDGEAEPDDTIFIAVKHLANLLASDAMASFDARAVERMHADVIALYRIDEALAQEPHFQVFVLRLAVLVNAIRWAAVGEQHGGWTPSQKDAVLKCLRGVRLRKGFANAFRDDRVQVSQMGGEWIAFASGSRKGGNFHMPLEIENLPLMPNGWIAASLARTLKRQQRTIEVLEGSAAAEIALNDAEAICREAASLENKPWNAVERTAFGNLAGICSAVRDLQGSLAELMASLERPAALLPGR